MRGTQNKMLKEKANTGREMAAAKAGSEETPQTNFQKKYIEINIS